MAINRFPNPIVPDTNLVEQGMFSLAATPEKRLMSKKMNETSASRGKGGRPPIADRQAIRAATIGVRVSAAERAQIEQRAYSLGMTVPAFLRATAVNRKLPRPVAAVLNVKGYEHLKRFVGRAYECLDMLFEQDSAAHGANEIDGLITAVQQLRSDLVSPARQ